VVNGQDVRISNLAEQRVDLVACCKAIQRRGGTWRVQVDGRGVPNDGVVNVSCDDKKVVGDASFRDRGCTFKRLEVSVQQNRNCS